MMTRRMILLLIAAVCCASCVTQPRGDLAGFAWLIGDWATEDGAITEHWQVASNNTFEGKGVTTTGTKVSTESMRLLVMEGEIFFVAKVAHNDVPVAFRLTKESKPGHGVFSNPAHDFPKRIVYDRDGENRMTVTVSDGGSKGFELRFSRR